MVFTAFGNGEHDVLDLFAGTFETMETGNPSGEYFFMDRAFLFYDVDNRIETCLLENRSELPARCTKEKTQRISTSSISNVSCCPASG